MPVLLEVCVASVDDARTAVAGGAKRLELNSALTLGGLTPSLGLMIEVRRHVPVPVVAMVRPRPGGFGYSDTDFDVMRRDADLLLQHGADGLAFGLLTEKGDVDRRRCRILRDVCGEREVVFHRAFDVTPDPFAALEVLIDLGFTRVMTSGQEATATEGAELIAELRERAAGRIEVMAAAGINAGNVAALVRRTGCRQVHASVRGVAVDQSVAARPQVRFGSLTIADETTYAGTDLEAVVHLRSALESLG
jgi:copper homeostasis protein